MGAPKTWREEHAEKLDEFYHWMGRSVSAWAFADEAMFNNFRDCVGPYEQCAIIYYRSPGLDIRANLTDEIVLSVLPKPERKEGGHNHPDVVRWKALKQRFTDLLSTRRQIAHQQVHVAVFASEVDDEGEPKEGATWATAFEIWASAHERVRETGSVYPQNYKKPAITVDDLKRHFDDVEGVTTDLGAFLKDVLAKPRK